LGPAQRKTGTPREAAPRGPGYPRRLAARAKVNVQECRLRRDDLHRLDELFRTGTTSEVLPVIKIDDTSVGNGQPGPVTRKLQAAYAETLAEFLVG